MISELRKTLLTLLLCVAGAAYGQNWPAKPVYIVVPFAPGGPVDTMTRTFASYFDKRWSQPVLVVNRPGGGGQIGAEAVAKSPADGYVLLMTTSSQAAAAALYKKLNYDPVNDLAPVSMLMAAPSLFAASSAFPPRTLQEFIALAKSQPGKINFGSSGMGSGPHLAMEIFMSLTGINMVHVPFKGDAQLYPSMFSNDVQVAILAPQTGLAHIKSGRLRALAVTGPDRFWSLPDAPGMVEAGVPAFDYRPWIGLFAPGKTPRDVIAKINADSVRVLAMPEMLNKHLPSWGSNATPGSVDSFSSRYQSEVETYREVVKKGNIPLID